MAGDKMTHGPCALCDEEIDVIVAKEQVSKDGFLFCADCGAQAIVEKAQEKRAKILTAARLKRAQAEQETLDFGNAKR